jgi:3-methyladenine DNA glycosylase AlkD
VKVTLGTVSSDVVIDVIREGLATLADPAKAPAMQAYMKSSMPFYGVQKPVRAKLATSVFAEHPLDGFDAWERTIQTLWRGATFREERYMALALLQDRRYAAYRTMEALPLYEELIVTGAWWDYVDEVSCGPLGELLPEAAPALRAWSIDAVMWKRRASIIAQVRRKRETDFALLTDCIEPNRADSEFFIRKAIGWGLRAFAWVDPEAVVVYCDTHELSPLSRREALKNL